MHKILFVCLLLVGCGHPVHDDDVWVEKYTITGERERVVLIFNFWDNYTVCEEFIVRMVDAQERWRFSCVRANAG